MFHLQINRSQFDRALEGVSEKRMPWAAANALNDTAKDVLTYMQDRMEVVFDRPTRFTKNAFMVWKANPRNMTAAVQERNSVGPRHFLKVQERGGSRGQTGLEGLLSSRLAYSGVLAAAIPADGAKLDAFGNWSKGERNQVLSALGAQRDTRSNATDASRKREKNRASYFVPKHGLTPGVYRRETNGALNIVLAFVDHAPVYEKRLGFYDGAGEVFEERLPINLRASLEKELAKAALKAGR
ncbi:hypothetical protein [Albirhodobacter sp. R86504]|uniref:hypothetical protein n=1 Tax=Albirhodobacter sp. R86504 TaxID=3093848 RepID=UPI003671F785